MLDDVDPGDVPATPCQLDSPDAAAGAEVEGSPVGRLPALLLPVEQFGEPVDERILAGGVLPGMEPDPVGQCIVHSRLPYDRLGLGTTPAARRLSMTTLSVSPNTSVGLNSTMSVPA